MIIRTVVASLLGASCYVVGDEGGPAVVIDPGFGVVDEVLALVRADRLDVTAVLATHGHVDHTWSAGDLCELLDVPFVLHQADVPRVLDPFGTLGPLGAQLAAMVPSGVPCREPATMATFGVEEDLADLDLGGGSPLGLRAMHCPGHTEGSTVYLLGDDGAADAPGVAFTGDVLFAGTIGRVDLPGGDARAMARTLSRLVQLPDETTVHPGHGPASSIGAERRQNPYLRAGRSFLDRA